jgi:hypothetical protein
MKSIEFIIVCVVTILGALTKLNWKKDKIKNKMLLILVLTTIIGALVIAYNRFLIDDKAIDESNDYLLKNRAKLIPSLFIDSIQNDSIIFHLKIKNIKPISAKKISYSLYLNDGTESLDLGIKSEIGENETHLIYPTFGNATPASLSNGTFFLIFSLYYNSVWKEDTLTHNEKFDFYIPANQIEKKEYEPIIKFGDNIHSSAEIDSASISEILKKDSGMVFFTLFPRKARQPLSYVFNTDSAALIFNALSYVLTFQQLFSDGELLTIEKQLIPNENFYDVCLLWSKGQYTLGVNKEPDTIVYRKKTNSSS